jgi:hypothetical protein
MPHIVEATLGTFMADMDITTDTESISVLFAESISECTTVGIVATSVAITTVLHVLPAEMIVED